ncbi:MAG: bifunctional riboflavin kinase/FAD synthetase [Ignavibacteriaceae bacterium]|nr:bifunctional riboflavin kinase/FAD synthetase [Ignavibacteriaceae bacterium]
MPVYRDFAEVGFNKNTVISLGTFDGVHLGHRQIVGELKKKAAERGCRSLIITFDPHPRTVLGNGNNNQLLTTTEEKVNLFISGGCENVLVINFTKEFSQIPYDEFLNKYIGEQIGLDSIIVGHDHRFGRGREGDFEKIEELGRRTGFTAFYVPQYKIHDIAVSSSNIRDLIKAGGIVSANKLLGWEYSLQGEIVEGFRRGRTLGFPTANIGKIAPEKILPGNGVYAVNVHLSGEVLTGALNLGVRPTFEGEPVVLPEVHIFDFNREVYGEKVKVSFVEKIRDEKKFASVEELKTQIGADISRCIEIFNKV